MMQRLQTISFASHSSNPTLWIGWMWQLPAMAKMVHNPFRIFWEKKVSVDPETLNSAFYNSSEILLSSWPYVFRTGYFNLIDYHCNGVLIIFTLLLGLRLGNKNCSYQYIAQSTIKLILNASYWSITDRCNLKTSM